MKLQGLIEAELVRLKEAKQKANLLGLVIFFKNKYHIKVTKELLRKRCADLELEIEGDNNLN